LTTSLYRDSIALDALDETEKGVKDGLFGPSKGTRQVDFTS
jgi:hypothetical protein